MKCKVHRILRWLLFYVNLHCENNQEKVVAQFTQVHFDLHSFHRTGYIENVITKNYLKSATISLTNYIH